jgi:hypothetical protein
MTLGSAKAAGVCCDQCPQLREHARMTPKWRGILVAFGHLAEPFSVQDLQPPSWATASGRTLISPGRRQLLDGLPGVQPLVGQSAGPVR